MKSCTIVCAAVLILAVPGRSDAGWPIPVPSKPSVDPGKGKAPTPTAASEPGKGVSAASAPGAAAKVNKCEGVEDTRDDVDFGELFREDIPSAMAGRQKLIQESPRALFIVATQDVTENDLSSSYQSKNPQMLFRKGEPLLLLTCFRDITRDVLTLDLHRVGNVPVKLLDAAPAEFALPEAPVLWDFDAHKAYVFATPADMAAVPGSDVSMKLEDQCKDKGLDACVTASKKIKNQPWRPDTNDRADKACEIAKVQAINACMGGKAGKTFEQNARQLDDLRRNRAIADFGVLKAKFAKNQ